MRNKKPLWITLIVIGCIFAYQILGVGVLSIMKEGVAGDTGKVWSDTKLAVEKLPALQDQAEFFTNDRQVLFEKITAARMSYDAANASGDLNQLNQAMTALGEIKVIVENYPLTDLSEVQRTLMDETSGALNRINFSRKALIDSQVSFNTWRILFFPVGQFFPRMQVLGERTDPEAELKLPKMGQGDYGK